jgi:tryptophan synthase beta subunit
MVDPPTSASSGFLTMLNESLSFHPDKADLWMIRFDVLRSLGYKDVFRQSLVEASASAKVRKELNWPDLRRMWDEVAPGEPFPIDAEERIERKADADELLPDLPAAAPGPSMEERRTGAIPIAGIRRFNDIAVRIAAPELAVLSKAYNALALRPGFFEDYTRRTQAMLQRPTPLEYNERLSQAAGTEKRVYLKREDLRGVPVESEHAAAQCYIGSMLGKKHVVTGNDVDLHSLEVATVARFFQMKCTVVVRPADLKDKPDLIEELQMLEAQVLPAPPAGMMGTDPREGAVRLWKRMAGSAHLILSLGMAPAPYPAMANAFQSLMGREADRQYAEMAALLKRPHTLIAAVGSEADSIGFVLPFLNRREIRVAFAEPEPGGAASWRPGVRLRPYRGQIREHSWLRGAGRSQYVPVPDAAAAAMRERLLRDKINISLEDARAVALADVLGHGDQTPRDFLVLVG